MLDPFSQGLRAVSASSPSAFPLVFLAGAVSSIGPCMAPRFVAAAGLVSNQNRRPWLTLGAFVAGLILMYAGFGAVASMVGRAIQLSNWLYAALAVALAAAGVWNLWKEQDDAPNCTHVRASSGAAFLLGASLALVISPCCAPILVGILAYTSAAGNPLYGSELLAVFALGHAIPVLAVGAGARGINVLLGRLVVRQAASVLGGTMMLVLSIYYAVLA